MGRSPCCDENGLKKGPWTQEEDEKLLHYIKKNGHGSWRTLPRLAGLNRCGKSCRLRWTNYLRPDIKRGKFSAEEEQTILQLHSVLGNKWSAIAAHLPGRTDNEIKNFWNTHLKKRLIHMGFDPMTHRPRTDFVFAALPQLIALAALRDQLQDMPQLQLTAAALGLVGGLCPPQQLTAALDYSSTTTTAPGSSFFPISSEEGEAGNNNNNNNQQQQTAGLADDDVAVFSCHGGSSSSPSLPPLTDLADAANNLPTASSTFAAASSSPLPCWPELFFFPDDDPFITDFL